MISCRMLPVSEGVRFSWKSRKMVSCLTSDCITPRKASECTSITKALFMCRGEGKSGQVEDGLK